MSRIALRRWSLRCLALAAGFALAAPGPLRAADIPLYGLYETSLDYAQLTGAAHGYGNPFWDVTLQTTFTSPTGKSVTWWGFHDGDGQGGQTGNIWKIRFMPDELGTWSFTWSFSDGSATSPAPVTFDAVAAGAKPGPLRHDPDIHQWLITADGSRHIFLNSYSPSNLAYHQDIYASPATVVADIKNEGFDVVLASGPIHHIHRNAPKDSTNPWIYQNTVDYTPRLAGWHLVEDGVYQTLYDEEMYLYEFYGFFGGNGLFNLFNQPAAVQNRVIRYHISRSAPYFFFLYSVGFELNEFVNVPSWPASINTYVKSIDPWDHLTTAHELLGFSYGPAIYKDVIDFSALQEWLGFHSTALNVWNSPSEPHPHCAECIWNAPWHYQWMLGNHRQDLWDLITAGMSVTFFARDGQLGLPYFRYANQFLKSGVRWWLTTPRDDLVVGGGAYLLAAPGSEYVAYSCQAADGCPVSFTVNVASGNYEWRWFNPSTGLFQPSTVLAWGGGPLAFTKPDSADWVLWMNDVQVPCNDADQDGYGDPPSIGCTFPLGDCDDTDDSIHPGVADVCDGIDNDCDPATADGAADSPPPNSNQSGVCAGSTQRCTGAGGWVDDYSGVPGYELPEASCDGLDNDCDGQVDVGCTGCTASRANWSVWFVDSEELVQTFKPATFAIDDDPTTWWHTEWSGPNANPPHEIQIDMGEHCVVSGFTYHPRNDGFPNGTIEQFEFYVGLDGSAWTGPVASGQLFASGWIGSLTPPGLEVPFDDVEARYLRLVAISEVGGAVWTAAAEIEAELRPDCDAGNPAAWDTPGEVRGLLFVDATTLSWSPPARTGGASLGYDTIRSNAAEDLTAGAFCVETADSADTVAVDADQPAPGLAYYYVVRAVNGCPAGAGSTGADSSGLPRAARGCP